MKTFLSLLCGLCLPVAASGQTAIVPAPLDPGALDPSAATAPPAAAQNNAAPANPPTAATAPGTAAAAAQTGTTATAPFTADELNQLVGPVALYPDPLLGLILPASTVPSDIVLADRYIDQSGDPSQIANQPWDESVKGLTHYADVLKWLDQNLAWTTQLGEAYLAQPGDVMDAIQRLRAQAKADGTLVDTDQQQVGVENGDLVISPTDVGTLYVPQYDPNAVYDDGYIADYGPVITFGVGYATGPWLYYWPNWHRHCIYQGNWKLWWSSKGGVAIAADTTARPWTPNPSRVRAVAHAQAQAAAVPTAAQARPVIAHPRLLAAANVIAARRTAAEGSVRTGVVVSTQGQAGGRGSGAVTGAPKQTVVKPPVAAVNPPAAAPVQPQPQPQAPAGYGQGNGARAGAWRAQFGGQGAAGGRVTTQPPVTSPGVVQQGQAGTGAATGGAGAGGGGGRGNGGWRARFGQQ